MKGYLPDLMFCSKLFQQRNKNKQELLQNVNLKYKFLFEKFKNLRT
ncbi:unknown [Tannerella sp. CAG:118]|uniref:Uncharacterized protein n=1 Tax=Coprobacter secundus subsp. similis TaxID=2751153 RepID=A0A7G1HSB7_9BACT|nr:hypothetical protein Cop2CBH44_09780 [Coprobacter secundus subsp. similis]CCY37871.1 unknown [Tannerella sp. CAG:118]